MNSYGHHLPEVHSTLRLDVWTVHLPELAFLPPAASTPYVGSLVIQMLLQ